ncbi:MAG: DUF624 domain-containing protein [Clostridia bacterium]|nr:DUF624 domain-containing protein [Clostridia bacterium]
MKNDNKKKRFRLFDLQREGRGISKKEKLSESGLKRFFITYKNNFGKMVYCNIYMVLGNFPALFLIAVLSGLTKLSAYAPISDSFFNLGGIYMIEPTTPFSMSLYALNGLQDQMLVNSTLSYVFYGIGALVLLTFGCVNVGTAYILRNIAKGEPVFIWHDFWYAIKRNWKQALPFGVIDGIINGILIFNIYTTVVSSGSFLTSMMFWANIVLTVLYFFMRCYIYVQMVTFKLSVFKILKNSLIFALLGFKRNILALLGSILFVLLEIVFFFSLGGLLVPFGIAAPLAVMLSSMAYMKVYAAYFKIKTVMIDPYYAEHPELVESHEDEEVVMHDDVTERERLAEIKKRNNIE